MKYKMKNEVLASAYLDALNKLHKWRKMFVSWQLGTRPDTDGEALALADHRSLSLCLRAEVNALTFLLVEKGVFTEEEFITHIIEEAKQVDKDMERRFPGVYATESGLRIVPLEFMETSRKMHFPP